MTDPQEPGTPAIVTRMNIRIAELVKEAQPTEVVELLSGPASSLLRLADQQQQQQQQQQAARRGQIGTLTE